VLGAFVVVFCALGYKAYSLQIDRGQVLSRIANKQYEHQQKEVGLRGAIFDRNMNALALGEESFSLAINPKKIP